jgi:hypothetical protein
MHHSIKLFFIKLGNDFWINTFLLVDVIVYNLLYIYIYICLKQIKII